MNVWWLTINRAMVNSYLGLKHRMVIAQGWPQLGDLSLLTTSFTSYWQFHRSDFEHVLQLLAAPVYPSDSKNPHEAFKNLFNLLSISQDDLVVAVESAQGPGPVMGITQATKNAWDSYRHDDPYAYDYAHTVCFPTTWIDWELTQCKPPRPPAMIAGVQLMGADQASYVRNLWDSKISMHTQGI